MDIKENFNLAQLTTFHIGGPAKYFATVQNLDELIEAVNFAQSKKLPILILGGSSNVLVSDRGFTGLVIEIDLKGIEVVNETSDQVEIKASAGEIWDKVVAWSVEKNLWGIENLSYVPGRTGAVPVQNVGCYGQEASMVVAKVEVLDLTDGQIKELATRDLGFGYRFSRFNSVDKNRFVILNVFFRLSKKPKPILNYVDLRKYFEEQKNNNPTIGQIREALGQIRGRKFPKVSDMGNDGSCFKNLLLNQTQLKILDDKIAKNFSPEIIERYEEIKKKFPVANAVKIPSAFLVDICGLKGTKVGDAMLWDRQPLVIVNTTNRASSADVAELFRLVRQTVFKKTGMALASEPEWVGFTAEELDEYFKL